MCGSDRASLAALPRRIVPWIVAAAALAVTAACGGSSAPATPRSTAERAARRAYDGAPPTIPHDTSLAACVSCHSDEGMAIPGAGFAPASPHGADADGSLRRCRQCHVPAATASVLVKSNFLGLPQAPLRGERATPGAPPTIPHSLQLRQNCVACHAGPAARAEIRTTHPERIRCRQCHVPQS
jgi:cytochrome c-type protein NapB